MLNRSCGRVRATEHAPRNPCRILERRHSLADIVERGTGVLVERHREGGSRVLAGAMRAAGFVDVKIDVTRLQGAARWTPVVGAKAR